jgi:hypothetical protein
VSLSGKHPAQEHIYTGSMMATLFSLTTSCLAGRKQALPASRLLVGNSHFTEGLSPGWINLSETQARAYMLADNKFTDRSSWDDAALAVHLKELSELVLDFDIEDIGFELPEIQWWAAWRLGSQSYREDKRGVDRGIDGNILFKNGPYGDGRIIVSVKGGENVGVQMVRDLRGVIEREESELGILITLVDPTVPMTNEASAAGFLSRSAHGRLPRLQIATVEDMLAGRMPKLPPLPQPERKLTSTIRRRDKDQLELLLPFEGEKIITTKVS